VQDGFEAGIYDTADSVARKQQIDEALQSLQLKRREAEKRARATTISDARIARIMSLVHGQAKKVAIATTNFTARRELVKELDFRAVISRKSNGEVKIDAACIVGTKELSFDYRTTRSCSTRPTGSPAEWR
jgi:hypothetical protein